MKKLEKLTPWDFKDVIHDRYEDTSIPDITRNNFQTLIDKYNDLVDVINTLCEEGEEDGNKV